MRKRSRNVVPFARQGPRRVRPRGRLGRRLARALFAPTVRSVAILGVLFAGLTGAGHFWGPQIQDAVQPAAETFSGRARAVDGDTLVVAGRRVRLDGIAAPELDEARGAASRARMAALVQGKTVTCEDRGRDRYGRTVGRCFVEEEDVARLIVAAGLARDCPRYSRGRYAGDEVPASRMLPFPGYCETRL
ncbi:thermonuclease family protein [Futiania mangrovi]|uniref:Thermonuclease family protein n=1 Tax=Futiania mangrovi TaxID=2959716 RepID=A0A9J6PMT7_9PROT|nr:thermonuclease family protein [Futiania mangrovii]MCP1337378.1 thermonuclease family protein [Futiania mangrovii]